MLIKYRDSEYFAMGILDLNYFGYVEVEVNNIIRLFCDFESKKNKS